MSQDLDIKEYVMQYKGHQRFTRLESIVEFGDALAHETVVKAVSLGYQLAEESRNPGMHQRIQKAETTYYRKKGMEMPAS